ncbi:MAG TPA: glycosyltransferase family 39 protein, partial [Vicinamibacterales bacterium]|nr:glycosyltransferase family 39 protein [Vicinamibacterales bacterium]
MSAGRTRLRLALSTLGFLAAAWSLTLVVTRGVSFTLGTLHVSSRNARNPAIGALLLLIGAVVLAPAGARRRTITADITGVLRGTALFGAALPGPILRLLAVLIRPRVLTALAVIVVGLTLALAWTRGAFVAGGSDSYGYVSEGHLFATGQLRPHVPLARAFPHVPLQGFTPLGYRPADDGTDTLVPTYAPGLPLAMAVAERIGGMDAVYVVMPLLAAIAVWSAYLIGARLAGPGTGLGAALLVLASPAFVFQMIGAPMSDVSAAGWWTLALALLLRDARPSTLVAGVAAGAAILTRPNLLLVVVVPGLYLLWLVRRDAPGRRERLVRLALFSSPVVVACLTVAGFNAAWYGSPFRSGYPAGLFNASYWDDNIRNFSQWLIETQTPIFFLGFAAPFVVRWLPQRPALNGAEGTGIDLRATTLLLIGVVLAVFASYLFYMPFGVWWYLRFLLPAFPALAALTCITLAALSVRFGTPARVLCVAAVIMAALFGWSSIKDFEALGENRYRIIGEWVHAHLPDNAIVVASQHSGNVKHYGEREIVRYDLLPMGDFESALDEMIAAGYHPFLVVDEWEV